MGGKASSSNNADADVDDALDNDIGVTVEFKEDQEEDESDDENDVVDDETRFLHDNRGPVLESIVARIVCHLEFTKDYRPYPLHQHYIGITVKKPLQRFQLMNDICCEKVMAGDGKYQVFIFVHSRKGTAKTVRAIRDTTMVNDNISRFLKKYSASREILQTEMTHIQNNDLKDLLPYGFAIHHAGVARSDHKLVEDLFADEDV
ncbi:hypothetical protein GIB67_011077 [Kingdonia uniflora]|uniref:Uncharacterized protein n=1 Tax=Kingdonia uniflora TaxID=39325 RepID=A0A7J7L6K6_9MAGN|nr:hypothetical protein GIB67_011077 [Kingdonia uniflora]